MGILLFSPVPTECAVYSWNREEIVYSLVNHDKLAIVSSSISFLDMFTISCFTLDLQFRDSLHFDFESCFLASPLLVRLLTFLLLVQCI